MSPGAHEDQDIHVEEISEEDSKEMSLLEILKSSIKQLSDSDSVTQNEK